MNYRIIGAVLVFIACGGWGFIVASQYGSEVKNLKRMMVLLDMMECELSYHLTPLPELCRSSGAAAGGILRRAMEQLALELDRQIYPDVSGCMQFALAAVNPFPGRVRKLLIQLGQSLGRFDLSGQLQGIAAVREQCRKEMNLMEQDKDQKIRSYQTLGICAGASLIILFI